MEDECYSVKSVHTRVVGRINRDCFEGGIQSKIPQTTLQKRLKSGDEILMHQPYFKNDHKMSNIQIIDRVESFSQSKLQLFIGIQSI